MGLEKITNNIYSELPPTLDGILLEEDKSIIPLKPKLRKSEIIVLKAFEEHYKSEDEHLECITPKKLLNKVSLSPRTVRYSLKRLTKDGFIVRRDNFSDSRQWLYCFSDAYLWRRRLNDVSHRKRRNIPYISDEEFLEL